MTSPQSTEVVIPVYGLDPAGGCPPPHRYAYGAPGAEPICVLHTHDRPEVFWIERGRCRHAVNGAVCDLYPGALVFIRPQDRHRMDPLDHEGFTVVNLVVHRDAERDLRERYATGNRSWPWWEEPLPRIYQLERSDVQRLGAVLTTLVDRQHDGLLERDLLVLMTVRLAWNADESDAPRIIPGWLVAALVTDPADPRSLAAACERGLDHVNRTIRGLYGCTAREFLLRRRLENAAIDLAHGDAGIARVAIDHGFDNLAWFHRAFRARYGCTPRRYRLACRRPVNHGRGQQA